jgi:hypothetical protein
MAEGEALVPLFYLSLVPAQGNSTTDRPHTGKTYHALQEGQILLNNESAYPLRLVHVDIITYNSL